MNNNDNEVNAIIDLIYLMVEKKIVESYPLLLRTTTGKIIGNVIADERDNRFARVRPSSGNVNGSEDIKNMPITTSQVLMDGDDVLITFSGNNFANAVVSSLIMEAKQTN